MCPQVLELEADFLPHSPGVQHGAVPQTFWRVDNIFLLPNLQLSLCVGPTVESGCTYPAERPWMGDPG